MYVEKFSKNGRVYFGFFSDPNEYLSDAEIPAFIRSGELSSADLKEAEEQGRQGGQGGQGENG